MNRNGTAQIKSIYVNFPIPEKFLKRLQKFSTMEQRRTVDNWQNLGIKKTIHGDTIKYNIAINAVFRIRKFLGL